MTEPNASLPPEADPTGMDRPPQGAEADRPSHGHWWLLGLLALSIGAAGFWLGQWWSDAGGEAGRDGSPDRADARARGPGPPRPLPQENVPPSPPPASAPPAAEPTAADVQSLRAEAIAVTEALAARYPQTPDSFLLRARLQLVFRETGEAAQSWKRALELDPRCIEALLGLTSLAMDKGDYAEAATQARQALVVDPASADARNLLGNALTEMGKIQEAIRVFEENLGLYPNSPQTHYMIGKAYLQLKDYGRAKAHYESAIKINPGYVHAYHGLGTVYAKLGRPEESKSHLQKFKELRDKISGVQLDRLRTGDLAKTREDVADILAMAGEIHAQRGNFQDAEGAWKRGASIGPRNTACRRGLATLYRRQERFRDALEMLKTLTQIEPNNPEYYLKLGSLYGGLKEFEGAERAFQQVCDLAPQAAIGYAVLAKLYLDANRKVADALPFARKAVERERSAPNFFLLADACRRNGDLAGARSAIAQAVELNPKEPSYRKSQDEIREKR